ncbi:MAG: hypothetical protein LZF60_330005 [Nitrospira sp.]|nr:MAG: hypothetical protein LZF60_330005 [Nitrospira sp.]
MLAERAASEGSRSTRAVGGRLIYLQMKRTRQYRETIEVPFPPIAILGKASGESVLIYLDGASWSGDTSGGSSRTGRAKARHAA